MDFLMCALTGYLIGCMNPAYFVGRKKGMDIRTEGSGNAGASNALILFGKLVGILCAVFDIAKTWFVIWLCRRMFPGSAFTFVVPSVACILGHVFPVHMGFRGGKGLACLGGMILTYDWRVFLLMLTAELILTLITDYLCFVPVTASCVFVLVYGIMEKDWVGSVLLIIPAVVIFLRHRENFRRIRQGTELHLSYLWRPETELKRVGYK